MATMMIDAELLRETRTGCPIARVVYADRLEDQGKARLAQLVRDGIAYGPEPYDLLPREVWRAIINQKQFVDIRYYGVPRFDNNKQLFEYTTNALYNLEQHNVSEWDTILRVDLVPELCNRLVPGTRQELRRITTTLAEFDQMDALGREGELSWAISAKLHADSIRLRNRILQHEMRSVSDLARLTVIAMERSTARLRWPPETPVYECSFAYRLVPALLHRVIFQDVT